MSSVVLRYLSINMQALGYVAASFVYKFTA